MDVMSAACVGVCVGGGCVTQIGLLVWQLWGGPQGKRSKRPRGTNRKVAVRDEESSSDEMPARVFAATSKKTATPKNIERQPIKQSPGKEQPYTTIDYSRRPSKQSLGNEQSFTTDCSRRPSKQNLDFSRRPSKQNLDFSRRPSKRGSNMEQDTMIDFTDPGWQGFSMEEARNLAELASADSMSKTPGEVLSDLQRGNTRFWMGTAQRPESSAFERRALLTKQFPTVAVLSCADSRVPVEIVFDMGLGDMFVVRVAGNCLDNASLASLQYAVHHLKVKVLVIMGHEGCGAVKAAGLPAEDINREPESLGHLLRTLGQGLNNERLSKIHDKRARDREAVVSNVSAQVGHIMQDPGIMGKIHGKELIAVGAFYELSSGIVDFFDEVSGDLLSNEPRTGVTSSLASRTAEVENKVVGGIAKRPQIPLRLSSGSQRLATEQVAPPTGGKMIVDRCKDNVKSHTIAGG